MSKLATNEIAALIVEDQRLAELIRLEWEQISIDYARSIASAVRRKAHTFNAATVHYPLLILLLDIASYSLLPVQYQWMLIVFGVPRVRQLTTPNYHQSRTEQQQRLLDALLNINLTAALDYPEKFAHLAQLLGAEAVAYLARYDEILQDAGKLADNIIVRTCAAFALKPYISPEQIYSIASSPGFVAAVHALRADRSLLMMSA